VSIFENEKEKKTTTIKEFRSGSGGSPNKITTRL
jgi:hypothetical protein